jgi:hypothetical protein
VDLKQTSSARKNPFAIAGHFFEIQKGLFFETQKETKGAKETKAESAKLSPHQNSLLK